jgi:hypothetical protein
MSRSDTDSDVSNDEDEICYICGAEEESDLHKTCEICHKLTCLECIGITACQTTDCICHNCYDYKCENCQCNLDQDRVYVSDGDKWSLPICDECQH